MFQTIMVIGLTPYIFMGYTGYGCLTIDGTSILLRFLWLIIWYKYLNYYYHMFKQNNEYTQ